MMKSYDEDNLIYNRFDLIYKNDFDELEFIHQKDSYLIAVHRDGGRAILNVWGKKLPQDVFEQSIEAVFNNYADVRYIEITQGGNNYQNYLCKRDDFRIVLTETKQELLLRLKAKHRYNLKRQLHMMEEQYGSLFKVSYSLNIPDELVKLYFQWKKESHGIDYGLSCQQYLKEYHVTDAILIKAGETPIGIVFYCIVEDIAYLENFSYNNELAQYSPGYLSYVFFLEELITRKCRILYLGGGDYDYKRRFGAEERVAYSGLIYRSTVFNDVNDFFDSEGIHTCAIYGLGTGSEEFLCIKSKIRVTLMYGIDREEKHIEGLQTYTTKDEFPIVDAVLITIKSHNIGVENYLKQRFNRIYYWEDMAKRGIFESL